MPNDAGTQPGPSGSDGGPLPTGAPVADAPVGGGGGAPRLNGVDTDQEVSSCAVGGGAGTGVAFGASLAVAFAAIVRRTRAQKRATLRSS
jgi:hypothetical protein